jgi:hypothetical protein
MERFVFDSKIKNVLYGFMGLGVLCLAITFSSTMSCTLGSGRTFCTILSFSRG